MATCFSCYATIIRPY